MGFREQKKGGRSPHLEVDARLLREHRLELLELLQGLLVGLHRLQHLRLLVPRKRVVRVGIDGCLWWQRAAAAEEYLASGGEVLRTSGWSLLINLINQRETLGC